jgi:hypothetical protein
LLLSQVCELADAARNDLCLRASNERNQRFYQRLGFEAVAPGVHGLPMARQHMPLNDDCRAEAKSVHLAGRWLCQYLGS